MAAPDRSVPLLGWEAGAVADAAAHAAPGHSARGPHSAPPAPASRVGSGRGLSHPRTSGRGHWEVLRGCGTHWAGPGAVFSQDEGPLWPEYHVTWAQLAGAPHSPGGRCSGGASSRRRHLNVIAAEDAVMKLRYQGASFYFI